MGVEVKSVESASHTHTQIQTQPRLPIRRVLVGEENANIHIQDVPNHDLGERKEAQNEMDILNNSESRSSDGLPSDSFQLTHDLTTLEQITLPIVLDCLIQRFINGEFYTFAGPVLISLNPCSHPHPNSSPNSNASPYISGAEKFKNRLSHILSMGNANVQVNQKDTGAVSSATLNPKPHVYTVGARCLDNLKRSGNDQIVVVSGDTGAGKTTATQQLLCYFIHSQTQLSARTPILETISNSNLLQQKIYCATVILESLGNASTMANPNSSRFGRFLHLKYLNQSREMKRRNDGDSSSMSILGAHIQTCLLEKHRVSKCQPNERNFHIFYYTLVGAKKGLLKRLASVVSGGSSSTCSNNKCDSMEIGMPSELPLTDIDIAMSSLPFVPPTLSSCLMTSDEEGLAAFLQSLTALDFSPEEVESILEIIYGLILLLNLKFLPAKLPRSRTTTSIYRNDSDNDNGNDDKENDDDVEMLPEKSKFLGRKKSHFRLSTQSGNDNVKNSSNLSKISAIFESIFGVDFESMEDTLVARNFTAGRRKSCVRKPCEAIAECEERLSSLISTVYDALFFYILQRVNCVLSPSGVPSPLYSVYDDVDLGVKNICKISLLDLYGFEKLVEENHFEQLCINYANERLHQLHISHARSHLQEVESWMDMEFLQEEQLSTGTGSVSKIRDSGDPGNVFEKLGAEISGRLDVLHMALFTTLNEACVLNRSQSDEQIYSRLSMTAKESSGAKKGHEDVITCGRLHGSKCEFVVKHYAAEICYSLKGMVDKNRDYVPPELVELVEGSSSKLIRGMMLGYRDRNTNTNAINTPASGTGRNLAGVLLGGPPKAIAQRREKKTVLQRFKSSVDGLVSELDPVTKADTQDVHFIRCIRPNNQLKKGSVDRKLVEQQLYSTGIVDFIRITGNGFPIRISKAKFVKRFGKTLGRCYGGNENTGGADCLDLNKWTREFKCQGQGSGAGLGLGKTQVFLREETWIFLCELDNIVRLIAAKKVQRFWRNFQRRLKEEEEARRRAEEELALLVQAEAEIQRRKALAEEVEALRNYNFQRTDDWVGQGINAGLMEVETSFLRSVHVQSARLSLGHDLDLDLDLDSSTEEEVKAKVEDTTTGTSIEEIMQFIGPQGDWDWSTPVKKILQRQEKIKSQQEQELKRKRHLSGDAGDGKDKDNVRTETKVGIDWEWFKSWCLGEGFFVSADGSIVSRRFLHQNKVRVYLRKTALANSHVFPRRLMPQGLLDLLPA